MSERSEFPSRPDENTAAREPTGRACWGALSLLPFFGQAKKGRRPAGQDRRSMTYVPGLWCYLPLSKTANKKPPHGIMLAAVWYLSRPRGRVYTLYSMLCADATSPDELHTLYWMSHRDKMPAINQKVHSFGRWDHQVALTVKSQDLRRTLPKSLPLKDCSTHRLQKLRFDAGEHLSQLRRNLPRRKPEPIDWCNLRQRVKDREQSADLLFADGTADEIQAGYLPNFADLAGNHSAEGCANQIIAIVDLACVAHRASDFAQALLP